MASGWDTEVMKAVDVQSELDGVVWNKSIYIKVSAGMVKLGYNRNNTVHDYFNSWWYSY